MKFQIIAKTLAGLEEVLAKEIEAIGGVNIAIGNRMVSFVGDKKCLYMANLWLRTALRILKPIERLEASDPDELYDKVKAVDWTKYVAEGQTIAIDNTIFSENFRNSRYAIYRCKDAICDFFVEKGMKRPKISVASADVQLNLHITDEGEQEGSAVTISLDSSGEPLYKRGYKEQLTDAPISEVLAAGILLKAGWDGTRDLIDPMCGSGTFLVEAALIATNTPAGIYRKGFGFERWTVGDNAFDAELWQDLYDDDSAQKDFEYHIYGSDISKVAIEATEKNIRAAGLAKYITLEQKDFEDYTNETHPSMKVYLEKTAQLQAEGSTETAASPMLVFNPPYGKRLFTDVPTFYRMIGTALKRGFQGSEAWVISSDDVVTVKDERGNKVEAEPFDFVGLKPSVKIDLNNGGIVCQLRKYEMFKGKFQEFRADGNELEKKTADEGNKKFSKIEHKFSKKSDRRSDRGEKRGERGDKKPFDKDRKPARTRTNKTERAYEVRKDGTVVAKGATSPEEKEERKPFRKDSDRKPFAKKDGERRERKSYDKKGGDKKPFAKKDGERRERKSYDRKDGDKKPYAKKDGEKKPFVKKEDTRGNFKRNAEGKLEEREGNFTPRGKREFDPNRPMFNQNFDQSKHVLDFSDEKK